MDPERPALRRLSLIVNPHAGRGRARDLATRSASQLRAAGFEVELLATRAPGHATELVAGLDLGEHAAAVAVGGDGTLNEVLAGVPERPGEQLPPLGLIPAGAGNALAHDLDIGTPAQALRAIASRRARPVDLLDVRADGRRRRCFHMLAWGLAAAVNAHGERLRWLGKQRYTAGALRELLRWRLRASPYTLVGAPGRGPHLLASACLTQRVGSGMRLAPLARLDDGLVDLVQVRAAPRLRLARLLLEILRGGHAGSPLVDYAQVESFSVELEPDSPVILDGELERATRLAAQVLPGALRILS